jgi:hypothetical protein
VRILHTLTAVAVVTAFLTACTTPEKPSVPFHAHYVVYSEDGEVEDMVHTYFGHELVYNVYDSTHIYMRRVGKESGTTHWYDGSTLIIRDEYGDYCDCTVLSGELLDYWLENESAPAFTYGKDTYPKFNLAIRDGVGLSSYDNPSAKDTTWVSVAEELMNPWYDMPMFKGLPVKYAYRLRGKKVTYEIDSLTELKGMWDVTGWSKKCVRIPAEVYMGFSMKDSLGVSADRVWISGLLRDESGTPLTGEVAITTYATDGTVDEARSSVEQGRFDIQLYPEGRYILDFTSEGMIHRRIELDLADCPIDGSEFFMELAINLFEPESQEVADYCLSQLVGMGKYVPEQGAIGFNYAYTDSIMQEIARMREAAVPMP